MNNNLNKIGILKRITLHILNFNWFSNNENVIKIKKDNFSIRFGRGKIFYDSSRDVVRFTNSIDNFLDTLNKKCKNFDSTLFLKLFNETTFKLNNLTDDYISGNYLLSQKDSIYSIRNFKAKYHELLHLASSKRNSENIQSGFAFYKNPDKIVGFSVTEAYTQLLAERYFSENVGMKYIIEVL